MRLVLLALIENIADFGGELRRARILESEFAAGRFHGQTAITAAHGWGIQGCGFGMSEIRRIQCRNQLVELRLGDFPCLVFQHFITVSPFGYERGIQRVIDRERRTAPIIRRNRARGGNKRDGLNRWGWRGFGCGTRAQCQP